jgi:hypothetical protein
MPGRTIHLTENPNDFRWTIPKGNGRLFEDLIHKYLKRHVATRDGRVKVVRTRATGDAGRDFEVHFFGEVELFGLKIIQPHDGLQPSIVFIECKSTEHERLDDEFIVDASQHRDSEACSYVLVTNAVITPYCQYRAQREWDRRNSTFRLVDRRRLVDELHLRGMGDEAMSLGLMLPGHEALPYFDRSRLTVSCQSERSVLAEGHAAYIYLSMTNYSSESVLSEISIASDMRWSTEGSSYERVIGPGLAEAIELTVDRQELDGPSDLDLILRVNGRSQRLTISRPNYRLTFDPIFTGATHRAIAQDVRMFAGTATGFNLISVQGEAGVGKTRTIKEALTPLKDSQFEIFSYYFSKHQGVPSFEDFYRTFRFIDDLAPDLEPSAKVSALIRSAAEAQVPVLIQLEDMHHADKDVVKVLKQIILHPPSCVAPLVLVITGRDDHTFPNEEYYSLLQLVSDKTLSNVQRHLIPQLTDQEAKDLIRSVVVDIPDPGVERVHALGQNNPFVIIEFLQYLLDAQIARLLSRRTVGILNPEVFAGRNGLPATVEELYDRRLASLQEAAHGWLATEFLTVASFFGFVIETEARRAFFDDVEDGQECWALLCERRFVREDTTSHKMTFAHENLLHHVRRMARLPENAMNAAALILDRPGTAKRLDKFDLGEVYYLHQDFSKASECFYEILGRIRKVTNFSSEEIDERYFGYIPALFRVAKAVGESKADLSKIALAYGYMGVHNYPLMVAEKACATASEMLAELYPKEGAGLRFKVAVRQLRAHALQNMGRTGLALQEMLEIEARLSEEGYDWPEVEYDLYDRLQEYYRKSNHEEMARFYGRKAGASVKRAGDEKMLASHLITESLLWMYSGEQEARRRAAEAHQASKHVGIRRLITYTRLTELVVESLYSRQDPAVLKDICDEARAILRDAAVSSFSDSIMRVELLLGTLALSCCDDPDERRAMAWYYITSGQANSIRFGHGLFDWAFDNLAAVIDLDDRSKSDEDVRLRFRSCLERLKKRGLTFLGAQSGTYPNSFAISNIVRFFGQFQESAGMELIRSAVSTYDNRFMEDERASLELVIKAVKGQPIFWPQKSRFQMLRYSAQNGYFTPVF